MTEVKPLTDGEIMALRFAAAALPGNDLAHMVLSLLATIEAYKAEVEELASVVEEHEQAADFKPEETAPKGGQLLELLVEGDDNHTEDEDRWRTIGSNQRDTIGDDTWELAGWNWSHDFWCEARNFRVVGWREMRPITDPHFMTPWCAHTQTTIVQHLRQKAEKIRSNMGLRGTVASVSNAEIWNLASAYDRAADAAASLPLSSPEGEDEGQPRALKTTPTGGE